MISRYRRPLISTATWWLPASWRVIALAPLIGVCLIALFAATGGIGAATPGLSDDAEVRTGATGPTAQPAKRTAFLIPFSHWDTDWHDSWPRYSALANRNIYQAIQMAKRYPAFRYTAEQVAFVRNFWDQYPEHRADLKDAVRRGQFSFAWAGITQPETSLVAPAIQWRNFQLGQDWLQSTFGARPRTAWQSDAFGHSAAFPTFLAQADAPYLFIGRWQGGCNPDRFYCAPFPHAFYWSTPFAPDRKVLTTYINYPRLYLNLYWRKTLAEQKIGLREIIDRELERTNSQYLFLPVGDDFSDPLPFLPDLVDAWNADDPATIVVMADPMTAFAHLETQPLPTVTVDLNPLWQGFYGSRPEAKRFDAVTNYLLTAADKLAAPRAWPEPTAWAGAAINAHYDNIGAVGFDSVWLQSQRPRYVETVTLAADELARTVAAAAGNRPPGLWFYNPLAARRSEVAEIPITMADGLTAPNECLDPIARRAFVWTGDLPATGIGPANFGSVAPAPVTLNRAGSLTTLANGLVSVTLDADRGGSFASLKAGHSLELLAGLGDEVVDYEDNGDIYGSTYGEVYGAAGHSPADLRVVVDCALVARVEATLTLNARPITKTVTVRAGSPLIEVALDLDALPQSSAFVRTITNRQVTTRTDDLGFGPFSHALDTRPITPGTVTYQREVLYPVMAWSDVSAGDRGLSIVTRGIHGLAGANELLMLLGRQVQARNRRIPADLGDPAVHRFEYAYLPHAGDAQAAQPWTQSARFNNPLIPIRRRGDGAVIHIPLVEEGATERQIDDADLPGVPRIASPDSLSLTLNVANGHLLDIYRRADHLEAVIVSYLPSVAPTIELTWGEHRLVVTGEATSFQILRLEPPSLGPLD